MSKIFRETRQQLLLKGKTKAYLKYAFGEIALVVIGILIALGVNNWNQRLKNEDKITSILKEIQGDLLIDLEASNEIFDFHMRTDSISNNILNNRYTLEDYKNGKAENIGYFYRDFQTLHNGFDNLTLNLDKIPEKYKHLLPEIKNLYITLNTTIDVYNTKMRSVAYENGDELTKNTIWYQDNLIGKLNIDQMDYYLNDVNYKNLIARYMTYRNGIFQKSTEYRIKAIELYLKINEAIDSTDELPEIVNYKNRSSDDYTGVYELKETVNVDPRWVPEYNIREKNDQLVAIFPLYDIELKLLYYNKNTFFFNQEILGSPQAGFLVFDQPKEGHFYISNGVNSFAIYERVESN
jgi:hypothetical protein